MALHLLVRDSRVGMFFERCGVRSLERHILLVSSAPCAAFQRRRCGMVVVVVVVSLLSVLRGLVTSNNHGIRVLN